MKTKLVQQMQSYVAETCVGASAMRNQGGSGLVHAAREYFKTVDLATIPADKRHFSEWLDHHADALLLKFPVGARNFGAARKALNLFLRSAAYNYCLNRAFRLDSALPLLEVPLDRYAARHLLKYNSTIAKKWVGLKFVTRTDHGKYQLAALALAKQWEVHRVDLDVFFFREETDAA